MFVIKSTWICDKDSTRNINGENTSKGAFNSTKPAGIQHDEIEMVYFIVRASTDILCQSPAC